MNAHDPRPSPSRLSFTGFDIAGLACAGFALLWAAFAVVTVQPMFSKMFDDFGQQLPAFTQLCRQPWLPLALGIAPLGVTCISILQQPPREVRAVLMGLTLFLSLAGPGILLSGFYMPIYSLGYAIK